jgi:hypothetical protein
MAAELRGSSDEAHLTTKRRTDAPTETATGLRRKAASNQVSVLRHPHPPESWSRRRRRATAACTLATRLSNRGIRVK